jgi:glycosyltransferase involved in cell wall biosynthesis
VTQATDDTPVTLSSDSAIVPQRLVIVLPTTGEFDSRMYRIARTCVGRGHEVTVLARSGPGLAAEELDPAGYRIVRVAVDPVDGLPAAALWRRLLRRSRDTGPDKSPGGSSPERTTKTSGSARARVHGPMERVRTASRGVIRLAAIVLTVRAQIRASRGSDPGADLYHGMAYMGIPVAISLATPRRVPVVYDARDIYVDAGNVALLPGPIRRLVGRLERRWAKRADRVVTVNRPYAEVMASRWDLPLPLIVMNCSFRYEPSDPRRCLIHERLGLDPETPVVLYQGGFSRERGIEQLVAAIRLVRGAVLVLMGYGTLRDELEAVAADPAVEGRVRILPPVPPAELLDWIAAADVVAMPIQPTTLNHRLTTPNKLFEAMAAGVPVVASDLPGMASIVRDTGAGVLVDPTEPMAIAAAIEGLLADPAGRAAIGARSLAAAHDVYNWETQAEGLLAEYGRLTGRPW